MVIKDAKQIFFDKQINKVASLSKRLWDLMSWVKQHNLPPMESISFRDEPCNTLDFLWNAFYSTYNTASGHGCEMESLDEWPAFPEREWLDFTPNEVQVALAACAKSSAPGPDHITWSHLKLLLVDMETCSCTPSRMDTPPPTQSTPTPCKKGKKKCKNEDPHTPHGPRPTPSSDAGSADESEEVSPSPGPQSSSSKGKAPPPWPVIFDTLPPPIPQFFPESKHSGNLVAMLECANNTLLGWCRSSQWEDSWDQMHIACHLALTLKIYTQSG
jgi:hypothetical protein